MNNTPTFRQGRKIYRKDNDGNLFTAIFSLIFMAVLFMIPVVLFIQNEKSHYGTIMSLYSIVEKGVHPLDKNSRPGDLVHFVTNVNEDSVSSIDDDFNLEIKGAFNIKRRTEYCQWRESQHETCQTCTREVKGSDGSRSTESYDCNCVTEFFYTKGWVPYLIPSIMFDQPAAHHNPSRDPFPSRMFTAADAAVLLSSYHGDIAVQLPTTLLENTRASYANIDWTPTGTPPTPTFFQKFFGWFFTSATRYESMSKLLGTEKSFAALKHNFSYVGQGGYFFSPYESSRSEKMFQYFMQFMEGTLFDFQFGDIIQSCTPGDLRVSYQVQDPKEISVLAQISTNDVVNNRVQLSSTKINTRTTPFNNNGGSSSVHKLGTDGATTTVGFIHEGVKSVEEMIQKEQYDSFYMVAFTRGLLFVWAIPVSALIGTFLGKDISRSTFFTKLSAILSIWSVVLAFTWFMYWGISRSSSIHGNSEILHDKQIITAFLSSIMFGSIAFQHAVEKRKFNSLRSRLNAVWCLLGRWTRMPPHWRIEESYNGKH